MSRRPVSVPLQGEPQGILVDEGDSLRFVAVKLESFPLDGQDFDSVEAAERAIARVLESAAEDVEIDGMVA